MSNPTTPTSLDDELDELLLTYLKDHAKAQAHDRLQEHQNADAKAKATIKSLIQKELQGLVESLPEKRESAAYIPNDDNHLPLKDVLLSRKDAEQYRNGYSIGFNQAIDTTTNLIQERLKAYGKETT